MLYLIEAIVLIALGMAAILVPRGARILLCEYRCSSPIEADRPLMWGDGFVGIASVGRG